MTWKFDRHTADIFDSHARQHIPNYEQVITKTVQVADQYLKHNSAICDVGCATGNTLKAFQRAGYTNLYGVDNSQAMLEKNDAQATLICSEEFPDVRFDMIVCNWTLHFMKDKLSYIEKMYQQLNNNGILIVTDKVTLDPDLIELYHIWKLKQGVSLDEVKRKQQELIDAMHINSSEWYQIALKELGFTVHIVDAAWCFNTFLCFKTPKSLISKRFI